MTEREPDPLFDALREQLYGHERQPPSAVWAALEQQLRARRRRRAGRWLAGTLLVGGLLGGAAWWQLPRTESAAAPATPAVATAPEVRAARPGARALPPRTLAVQAAPRGLSLTSDPRAAPPTATSAEPTGALAMAPPPTVAAPIRHGALPAGPSGAGGNSPPLPVPESTYSSGATDTLRAPEADGGSVALAMTAPVGHSPRRVPRADRVNRLGHATALATTEGPLPVTADASSPVDHVAATGRAGQADPAAAARAATSQETNSSAQAQLLDLLPALAVTLDQPAPAAPPRPAGALVAVDTTRRPYHPPRWAIGLWVGAGLTHRRLSPTATPLARSEKADLGGQAELSSSLILSPRLRLRLGVGAALYQQQAHATVVQPTTRLTQVPGTIKGANGQLIQTLSWALVPDPMGGASAPVHGTVALRYLTVPLQAEWYPQLGSRRLRPVLAAGPVLNVLLSGHTAELTSTCGCETTTTGLKKLALGLNVGVGFDYALRPDVWLAVRPTATTFVTSASAIGRPVRYPFSAGLQVGVMYELPHTPRLASR